MSIYARRRASSSSSTVPTASVDAGSDSRGAHDGRALRGRASVGSPHFGEPSRANTSVADGNQRRSRLSSSTPFEDRVKNVRSKIREMMEEDAAASDVSTSASQRRSSAVTRAAVEKLAADVYEEEDEEEEEKVRPAARLDSRGRKPAPPARLPTPPAARGASVGLEDEDELIGVTAPTSARAARVAAARRGADAALVAPVPAPAPARSQDLPIVGRDVPARVGARVRVVDAKLARFVEPSGKIIEVRCEGGRVRIEHDGGEKSQRYYNTGKAGEYQLVLLDLPDSSGSSRPGGGDTDDSDDDRQSVVQPTGDRRRLPEPPPIVRDHGATARKSENLATGDDSDNQTPYARRRSRASVDDAMGSGTSRPTAYPARRSQVQSTELGQSAAAAVPSASSENVARRLSYSELRKARASAASASPGVSEETRASQDAAEIPTSYAERRKSRMSIQAAPPDPVDMPCDDTPSPAPRRSYSELRKIRASSSSAPPPQEDASVRLDNSNSRRSSLVEPPLSAVEESRRKLAAIYGGMASSAPAEDAPQRQSHANGRKPRASITSAPSTPAPQGATIATDQDSQPKPFNAADEYLERVERRLRTSVSRATPSSFFSDEEECSQPAPSVQQKAVISGTHAGPRGPAHPSPEDSASALGVGATSHFSAVSFESRGADEAHLAVAKADSIAAEQVTRIQELGRDFESLTTGMRDLERQFSKNMDALREETRNQMEDAERRIVARVLKDLSAEIQTQVQAAEPRIVATVRKNIVADAALRPAYTGDSNKCKNVETSDGPMQRHGGPEFSSPCGECIEEPEQEVGVTASESPKRVPEVTSAELADNRQRLENIGSIARRVSASLGGTRSDSETDAGPSGHSTDTRFSDEQLDKEMERLADLRRFASNVLGTARAPNASGALGHANHRESLRAAADAGVGGGHMHSERGQRCKASLDDDVPVFGNRAFWASDGNDRGAPPHELRGPPRGELREPRQRHDQARRGSVAAMEANRWDEDVDSSGRLIF